MLREVKIRERYREILSVIFPSPAMLVKQIRFNIGRCAGRSKFKFVSEFVILLICVSTTLPSPPSPPLFFSQNTRLAFGERKLSCAECLLSLSPCVRRCNFYLNNWLPLVLSDYERNVKLTFNMRIKTPVSLCCPMNNVIEDCGGGRGWRGGGCCLDVNTGGWWGWLDTHRWPYYTLW